LVVEKYTPDPTSNVLVPIPNKITRNGKKKGRPKTSTPNTIGRSATDAAASGTVDTRRIFADGNFNGIELDTELAVEVATFAIESMTENQDSATEMSAPISVRCGPVNPSFKRSVGWYSDDSCSFCDVALELLPSFEDE
jgi:hypothetical protein